MSAHAFNATAAINATLLAHHPVKLDDAETLTTQVTPDSIRGDLANALTMFDRVAGSERDADALNAITALLRSALCKVDDLLADQRAMRTSLIGAEQELNALRQQRLTIQGHAIDIENATAALLSEIHNR